MLQLLSAPLQSDVRLFQFPLPATPAVALADALAPKPGRSVGFTMLGFSDTNDLVPAFTPAVFGVRVFHAPDGTTDCVAGFGWSLSASLARRYNGDCGSSPGLDMS